MESKEEDPIHSIKTTSGENASAQAEEASSALDKLVDASAPDSGIDLPAATIHTPATKAHSHPWLRKLVPSLEKLASVEHLGNFITTRPPNAQKQWESMPIYVRFGMHLLFVTANQTSVLSSNYVENTLRKQSIQQGKLYDSEEGSQEHIQSFIDTYSLRDSLHELAEPDPLKYRTFNDFFTRKLKAGARPVDKSPSIISSSADSRLTVFDNIDSATKFWIKSRQFNLPHLLHDDEGTLYPALKSGGQIAIFRLAPADFHRFSSPVSGKVGLIRHIPGSYYTVNPQAVNEDFPVFTRNRRDVTTVTCSTADGKEVPFVIVAVGAMLVGSIVWTKQEGDLVEKGEELGYYAYGGSTTIMVSPPGTIQFDADLIDSSKKQLESVVKTGESIGKFA